MSADIESMLHDAPPPKVVLRIVNPLIRFLLRTPAARSIGPLALLDFLGRHTAQRRRVVVGWHIIDGNPVVLTPAAWRVNFTEGRLATVRWRGHDADYVGTLETNPDIVADVVNTLLRGGSSARSLALRIPAGHTVNAADIRATRRALIRFRPVATRRLAASPQPG
jgi:hypothetical protein